MEYAKHMVEQSAPHSHASCGRGNDEQHHFGLVFLARVMFQRLVGLQNGQLRKQTVTSLVACQQRQCRRSIWRVRCRPVISERSDPRITPSTCPLSSATYALVVRARQSCMSIAASRCMLRRRVALRSSARCLSGPAACPTSSCVLCESLPSSYHASRISSSKAGKSVRRNGRMVGVSQVMQPSYTSPLSKMRSGQMRKNRSHSGTVRHSAGTISLR